MAATKKTEARSTRPRLDEQTEKVNVLYYGEGGSGKTTALAGLARMGHVIHIDSESGVKAGPLKKNDVPIGNIEPFKDISFDAMLQFLTDIKGELEDNEDDPVGIMWDSITETQKMLLEDIARNEVIKANRAGQEKDPYNIEKGWWGKNTEQMRRLLRRFRDLPCHCGIAALERRDVDQQDGEVKYGPAVSPAFATDLFGYMDVVCVTRMQLVQDRKFYIGITLPFGKWKAKDRFGILPRTLHKPSLDRIVGYVNGDITEEDDEIQQTYIKACEERDADEA